MSNTNSHPIYINILNRVSAVDFPKVLVNFKKFAEKMGVKQIETFEGSFLELNTIPKMTYDRVVIANYLRIEK